MVFTPREIHKGNARALQAVRALLHEEDLKLDNNLDYTIGLYDEDFALAATGSSFLNTLRCLAVREQYQGEGLMAEVVRLLKERLFLQGIDHLFLYTKPAAALKLSELGFYEVARVHPALVFMENKRTGFADYLAHLAKTALPGHRVGAIILNANPFTKGHLYLVEEAAKRCDVLHLLIVSEDRSFFPFQVRKQLIVAGTRHIPHLYYHDTGSYLISSAVFPSYFIKEEDDVIRAQAGLDAALFVRVAEALRITDRYVGDEPFSHTTNLYNEVMQTTLPPAGIGFHVLPRKVDAGSQPVSATRVRVALQAGDLHAVQQWVPPTTYDYLVSPEGKRLVQERLQQGGGITKD